MAHFRGARGARFLTRCLLLVAALAARGQAAPAEGAQGLHFFDIPALPLAEALQRFTASTGHSGLYDSGLVAGRRSRGVAGHYTAESALRQMLGDSGLQARYGSPGTVHPAARGGGAAGAAA
ncbi:STN domain-containing protein, partial [Achromobacter sp. Marseille-Q0513]|uniref:STN domain-containing protein n=1 Tax=Achromobacter sp. Marseille-Q0513 TaxID=2829161 RepID=UPI001B914542